MRGFILCLLPLKLGMEMIYKILLICSMTAMEKIHHLFPQPQPSSQSVPSSSALLPSSIIALSSLSDGSTMTPFMTHLYQNDTCLLESITPISVDMPIPSSIVPSYGYSHSSSFQNSISYRFIQLGVIPYE